VITSSNPTKTILELWARKAGRELVKGGHHA
jgi:hypothetical protein